MTKKYILENFDIDKERKSKVVCDYIGLLDIDRMFKSSVIPVQDFLNIIQISLKGHISDSLELNYFGHDGAYEINVVKEKVILENDDEVVARLMKQVKKSQTKKNKINQARKLLIDNGFEVI